MAPIPTGNTTMNGSLVSDIDMNKETGGSDDTKAITIGVAVGVVVVVVVILAVICYREISKRRLEIGFIEENARRESIRKAIKQKIHQLQFSEDSLSYLEHMAMKVPLVRFSDIVTVSDDQSPENLQIFDLDQDQPRSHHNHDHKHEHHKPQIRGILRNIMHGSSKRHHQTYNLLDDNQNQVQCPPTHSPQLMARRHSLKDLRHFHDLHAQDVHPLALHSRRLSLRDPSHDHFHDAFHHGRRMHHSSSHHERLSEASRRKSFPYSYSETDIHGRHNLLHDAHDDHVVMHPTGKSLSHSSMLVYLKKKVLHRLDHHHHHHHHRGSKDSCKGSGAIDSD